MRTMTRITFLAILIAIVCSFSAFASTGFASSDQLNRDVIIDINLLRAANGSGSLEYDARLYRAAEIRAEESSIRWAHVRPDGSDYYTVDPDVVYGENLARDFSDPSSVIQNWMDSPKHRHCILNPRYTRCAVACYIDSSGKWYWAIELF